MKDEAIEPLLDYLRHATPQDSQTNEILQHGPSFMTPYLFTI